MSMKSFKICSSKCTFQFESKLWKRIPDHDREKGRDNFFTRHPTDGAGIGLHKALVRCHIKGWNLKACQNGSFEFLDSISFRPFEPQAKKSRLAKRESEHEHHFGKRIVERDSIKCAFKLGENER